jgi:hypothetical protein
MASRRVPGRHFCLERGNEQRQPSDHAARRNRGRRQAAPTPGRRAELQARFEREAQATSSLRSPHTIE